MFKLPDVPTPEAPVQELADFAEIECWRHSTASLTGIRRKLDQLKENDYTDGVSAEDRTERRIGEAFDESERRQKACRNGYPFAVSPQGNALVLKPDVCKSKSLLYIYMLLATRLRMDRCRQHAQIDGATLFEALAAEVVRAYFGDRAETFMFGANPQSADFMCRVQQLCHCLEEGQFNQESASSTQYMQDDKLDIVVWKHFADHFPGKLIAFGQCKTGTSYRDQMSSLQPETFCKKWIQPDLAVSPLRLFLVTDTLPRDRNDWRERAIIAGILFDRCRIMDFGDDICTQVMDEIKQWTTTAATANELPPRWHES